MPLPMCQGEHDSPTPAKFLASVVGDGEQIALCDECMVPWCFAFIQEKTGVDMTPVIEVVSAGDAVQGGVEALGKDDVPVILAEAAREAAEGEFGTDEGEAPETSPDDPSGPQEGSGGLSESEAEAA